MYTVLTDFTLVACPFNGAVTLIITCKVSTEASIKTWRWRTEVHSCNQKESRTTISNKANLSKILRSFLFSTLSWPNGLVYGPFPWNILITFTHTHRPYWLANIIELCNKQTRNCVCVTQPLAVYKTAQCSLITRPTRILTPIPIGFYL